MSQLSTHRSFWRHLLRAFPVFVIVTLITVALEHAGWLRGFETTGLDTWLRLIKPIEPQFVCVVTINDDDYLTIFGGKSPLDPKTVMTLIRAIADGKPTVIGVDIDTSDAQWQSVVQDSPSTFSSQNSHRLGTRSHWTGRAAETGEGPRRRRNNTKASLWDFRAVSRLGRRHPTLATLLLYCRRNERQTEIVDSFPWAIVKAFCQTSSQSKSIFLPNCNRLSSRTIAQWQKTRTRTVLKFFRQSI